MALQVNCVRCEELPFLTKTVLINSAYQISLTPSINWFLNKWIHQHCWFAGHGELYQPSIMPTSHNYFCRVDADFGALFFKGVVPYFYHYFELLLIFYLCGNIITKLKQIFYFCHLILISPLYHNCLSYFWV